MKKNILIVADPETMNDNLVGWVGLSNEFEMRFADTDDMAIELSRQLPFDMLVVDLDLETADYRKLKSAMSIWKPEVLILPYKGESSFDLNSKVKNAFQKSQLKRMKHLLVPDASDGALEGLFPFSAN
ncbi:MAG TPA: hypothetical protein VHK91_16180 [Flavisolibacter sp.]|jgi:DNA-binding NtrC family response regulator|nr:hypothetical protein [Flavisolibacter sp.]